MTREQTSLPHTTSPVGRLWDDSLQTGNYTNERKPVEMIVIHTMVGTTAGSTAHFKSPKVKSSAHYGVSMDGSVVQWIMEDRVAFHAGDYTTNQRSIGIEHEDGYHPVNRPKAFNEPRPDALYESSARLVADICSFYSIPLDRKHIVLHREVSKKPTACPGTLDINRIISRAKELMAPALPTEEPLVSHMMKASVFRNLVTKSTNWDDLCAAFKVEKSASEQYGMGKQLYLVLDARLKELEKELEQTRSKLDNIIPATDGVRLGVSSMETQVLGDGKIAPVTKKVHNPVWDTDVLTFIKSLAGFLKERVTIT